MPPFEIFEKRVWGSRFKVQGFRGQEIIVNKQRLIINN